MANGIRFFLDGKEWVWDGEFPEALDEKAGDAKISLASKPLIPVAFSESGGIDLVPTVLAVIQEMGGVPMEVISPHQDGSLTVADVRIQVF